MDKKMKEMAVPFLAALVVGILIGFFVTDSGLLGEAYGGRSIKVISLGNEGGGGTGGTGGGGLTACPPTYVRLYYGNSQVGELPKTLSVLKGTGSQSNKYVMITLNSVSSTSTGNPFTANLSLREETTGNVIDSKQVSKGTLLQTMFMDSSKKAVLRASVRVTEISFNTNMGVYVVTLEVIN